MIWNTILFDLDGTLTDPKVGITSAAAVALDYFGIHVEDKDSLAYLIGPPLNESFPEFYGFDEAQTAAAVEKFREYYQRQGWYENIPYPGIESLLSKLRRAGKRLAVATSKPEEISVQILEHFGLAQYFHLICGALSDCQEGCRKATVIRDALKRAGIEDLSDVVMVGDRRHDIAGAHEVGIQAIGVLYGYGDREELEKAGAEYIADTPEELGALLLGAE